MSYLDELKQNHLLTESFYYNPDKVTPEDPFEGLAEEIMVELADFITLEEMSENIDLIIEAPEEKSGLVQQYLLNKTIQKLRRQIDTATDAKKVELDAKIAALTKKFKGVTNPPPSPKGDITPVSQDFPTKLVPSHKVGGDAVEPGAIAKAAKGVVDYASQNPGKVVAISVGVAAAIAAGVVAYRQYLSKAARACKGSSNKSKCMVEARQKALKAKIKALDGGKAKCLRTSKPYTCRSKIDEKIQKLQAKIKD